MIRVSGQGRRRVNAIRGGVLAASAAVVIGGGVLALGHTGSAPAAAGPGVAAVRGQTVADSTGGCDAVHQQIKDRENVDVGRAQQCDQEEFKVLEDQRQAARARGEKPPVQVSETCRLVNERAADGDPELDFDLAFSCRQRERFANTTNATNGLAPSGRLTSLCEGAERRQQRGDDVDDFTKTFCAQEEQAAGGQENDPKKNETKPDETKPDDAEQNGGGGARTCTVTSVPGGGTTASGEANDPDALVAGSNVFALGTKVRVTNPQDPGRSVVVRINDRNGAFCVAMSKAAFEKIRNPGKELVPDAKVEVVK